ncbi:MAG: 23S rRNA (adenine(2503)-C(2))-methyltransferase RlmN [Verrucomicrobiota bacterium]|nr:23S rRNA (adenine(2503)-C(2))-methyltransferase RlmN [Verrucomicrobiota bacterium]
MQSLFGLTLEELKTWMVERGEKPFRATQLFDWLYCKKSIAFDAMTNFPKTLRDAFTSSFTPLLRFVQKISAEDGETEKFLWELPDGKRLESVLILSGDRRTVCVSSQVGCPARCAFCASGKAGLFRNLEAAEIVEQVWHIDHFLKEKGERVSHVVFMGMGEPMENYKELVRAIRLFISPDAFGLSQRRVTVSTVGVVEGILRLAEEDFKVNLALSLHAPTQELRKRIIPYARKYELQDILAAMDDFAAKTKRDITYEYTLLAGINDGLREADALADLLQDRQCTVNLIPYNPIPHVRLARPSHNQINAFQRRLQEQGIQTTRRYTKGDDIAAACGQLALAPENRPLAIKTEEPQKELDESGFVEFAGLQKE